MRKIICSAGLIALAATLSAQYPYQTDNFSNPALPGWNVYGGPPTYSGAAMTVYNAGSYSGIGHGSNGAFFSTTAESQALQPLPGGGAATVPGGDVVFLTIRQDAYLPGGTFTAYINANNVTPPGYGYSLNTGYYAEIYSLGCFCVPPATSTVAEIVIYKEYVDPSSGSVTITVLAMASSHMHDEHDVSI